MITFPDPYLKGRLVTHRVVQILQTKKGPAYRTKGDANPSRDPWTIRLNGRVGRVALARCLALRSRLSRCCAVASHRLRGDLAITHPHPDRPKVSKAEAAAKDRCVAERRSVEYPNMALSGTSQVMLTLSPPTVSRITPGSIAVRNASSLLQVPVSSIV